MTSISSHSKSFFKLPKTLTWTKSFVRISYDAFSTVILWFSVQILDSFANSSEKVLWAHGESLKVNKTVDKKTKNIGIIHALLNHSTACLLPLGKSVILGLGLYFCGPHIYVGLKLHHERSNFSSQFSEFNLPLWRLYGSTGSLSKRGILSDFK
jgi:hypothetical protein